MTDRRAYHLRTSGGLVGPVPWDEVKRRIAAGEIGPETEVAVREPGEPEAKPLAFRPLQTVLAEARPCARCGAPGALPRLTSRVTSMVFLTTSRQSVDVLCDRHGARKALGALATSGLLGWWGIPWGIVRTPGAIVANVKTLLSCATFPRAGAFFAGILAFLVPVGVVAAIATASRHSSKKDREEGRESVPMETVRHVEASRAALERGDAPRGLKEARAAVATAPSSWVALQQLGDALVASGDVEGAVAALRKATQLNADNLDLRVGLLRVLSIHDDFGAVEKEATSLIARWPDSVEGHALRAESRAVSGDLDGALKDLRASSPKSPWYPMALDPTCRALIEADRHEDVLRLLTDAAAAGAGAGDGRVQLGALRVMVLTAAGRFEDAVRSLSEVDRSTPGLGSLRGTVLLSAGNFAAAEADLREMAGKAKEPFDVADTLLWQGAALLRLGRTEAARETWGRSPAAAPGGAADFDARCCSYLSTGDGLEALRASAAKARSRPLRNDLLFVEGMRLESTGDAAGALAAYRRCMESSPGHTFPHYVAVRAAEALAGK